VDEGTGEVYYQGACNMMTQLFVALCRAVGIPARGVTGMVGWGPWVNEEDLRVREERHTELSADGLATARLSGPFGGHRWPEFYLPGYGWIPVDPTWDRFPLIDNRRVILSKGTDVLIGPGAPPGRRRRVW
jgi:transglutaminase-like putative cysteine protease